MLKADGQLWINSEVGHNGGNDQACRGDKKAVEKTIPIGTQEPLT